MEETVVGLPLLGGKAPDFEALTTQGTLRLSDYEGSWLVARATRWNEGYKTGTCSCTLLIMLDARELL